MPEEMDPQSMLGEDLNCHNALASKILNPRLPTGCAVVKIERKWVFNIVTEQSTPLKYSTALINHQWYLPVEWHSCWLQKWEVLTHVKT